MQKSFPRLAVLGAFVILANIASAQSTVETTTTRTTAMGTIRETSPDSITVNTQASTSPVHYVFTKTTTYVDENGNPVSVATVRSGAPVTVYYDQEGDRMVASKIVVHKSVDVGADGATTTDTTTATSTDGTVQEFSRDTIAVTSANSPTPVSYSFSKTTTYVDENGNPVSVEVVKSGVPVTVFFDYENGRAVASKVVVRGSSTTTTEDGTAVVEHQKTTTTTTTTQPSP